MKSIFILLLAVSFASNAYNINTGDVLHLEVFGEPELVLDVTVDSFGFIEYPFIGKLKASGNKIESIRSIVIDKLKDGYFINPQVTVFVKKYKPFFIQGEVNSPGSYAFEEGLTIRKAIALAGGLTERASKKKIYLTKAEDNSQRENKVNLDDKISSGDIVQIKESFF